MNAPRLLVLALVLAGTACSSVFGDGAAPTTAPPTTAPTTTTTTTSTTAAPRVETTIELVLGSELTSTGEVSIADRTFRLTFECYAAGAGDVLALGVGEDAASGQVTQAVVQAFLGNPYVALFVGDDVYELAIDRQAELFVQDDAIRGSALRFVRAVDGAGEGVDPGLGSVTVLCNGFAPGLPDGYARDV